MPSRAQPRPSSGAFPWYDSWWLAEYSRACDILRQHRPAVLDRFRTAMRALEAPAAFRAPVLRDVFDAAVFDAIERVVDELRPDELELHEARRFGRFVVHNHPFFTELQRQTVELVSRAAGERVEPTYNFLSLYGAPGVCEMHLDSPQSKWTLDVCVRQSAPWPIHFSAPQPWPEPGVDPASPGTAMTPYLLEPREAVLFSGSSQWHYRDPMPAGPGRRFCELLFFHFVPEGTRELVRPEHWARLFGAPELRGLGRPDVEFI